MSDYKEPLLDVAHLGRLELLTPKPEKSLWYFRDLLGMEVVATEGDSVYLRAYGDYARSTFKLTAADRPGPGVISWRCMSPQALERRVRAIEAAGLGIGWQEGEVGRGRFYRFRDPDGHLMDIYFEEEKYRAPDALRSTLKNLPQKYTARGANARRIDHLALCARDVAKNREFAMDLLGFRVREQVIYDKGRTEIGSWMSLGQIHHEMAYVLDVKGAHGRMHHMSFWIDNREDVLRAADILAENGIFIEAGPSKHNNSQAFYLYSYEPGGNRIEIYSGSFIVTAPDFETVTWNEEERGTGVYWGGALPASFLDYCTPNLDLPVPAENARVPVFDPA
jgi:catechol 2,3-dioxygenase